MEQGAGKANTITKWGKAHFASETSGNNTVFETKSRFQCFDGPSSATITWVFRGGMMETLSYLDVENSSNNSLVVARAQQEEKKRCKVLFIL